MKLKLLIIFLTTNSVLIFAQNYEPLDLAKKLFQTDFAEIKNYSTGEFEGHPNKSDLQKNAQLNFKTLSQNDSIAVVNVTVTDSLGKGFDSYLHFEKDKYWKINAFRGLAQTGILEQIVNEFEKTPQEDIKRMIDFKKKNKNFQFQSLDDFNLLIENSKLTIALDDNIIQHFTNNKEKIQQIKNDIEKYKSENPKLTNKEISKYFEKELKKLLLNDFGDFYFPCENCFVLTIGGMTDNTVGYFFQNNKTKIPQTNPSQIIMIREIGNGWYMFKTT